MLIAQISDLHIGPDPISALNDERLTRVVARVAAHRPDLVLVTGDLAEGGGVVSYRRAAELLAPLNAPLLFALGNHDVRANFSHVFADTPTHDGFVQYAVDHSDVRILVLDTLVEGQHAGGYCNGRRDWLDQALAEAPSTPTLIALHHPPMISGIDWMDPPEGGQWFEPLQAALQDQPQVIGIVAGHLHRPIATAFSGRPLIVCPSAAPAVGLDLRAIEPDRRDDRALIVEEPPGYALHRWDGGALTTFFGVADRTRVLARFDRSTQTMVNALITADDACASEPQ